MAEPPRITELLDSVSAGNTAATDELFALVYGELKNIARARMARERPGHTLQPTALVNEAYLRLLGGEDVRWQSRAQFFAAAAEAMRRILIDRARRKARQRHGGELRRTTLDEARAPAVADPDELLLLDEALATLEGVDEQMAAVVKLRYFAGLTVEETARAMDISPRSVNRQWTAARTWLFREMSAGR